MTVNKLMALLTIFVLGQLSCAVADAAFVGTVDGPLVSWVNNMMGFNAVAEGGWAVVTTPIQWITQGIPQMLLWNYACFEGGFFIVRVLLIATFSVASIFGLWQTLRSG